MFVIAYFHYNTLRSDIGSFSDLETAKKWLYERWNFLLEESGEIVDEELITFNELVSKFRDLELTIEMIIV